VTYIFKCTHLDYLEKSAWFWNL